MYWVAASSGNLTEAGMCVCVCEKWPRGPASLSPARGLKGLMTAPMALIHTGMELWLGLSGRAGNPHGSTRSRRFTLHSRKMLNPWKTRMYSTHVHAHTPVWISECVGSWQVSPQVVPQQHHFLQSHLLPPLLQGLHKLLLRPLWVTPELGSAAPAEAQKV